MAFCDLNGYMDTAEAMIKYIIKTVLERCPDEWNFSIDSWTALFLKGLTML